jgi:hypothetical protein
MQYNETERNKSKLKFTLHQLTSPGIQRRVQVDFHRLHGIISQKTELAIARCENLRPYTETDTLAPSIHHPACDIRSQPLLQLNTTTGFAIPEKKAAGLLEKGSLKGRWPLLTQMKV